jgi:hypothetical protein
MNENILWRVFGVLLVMYSIYSGIVGVKRQKTINNLAIFIISVGLIIFGITVLLGIIILIYLGKL